MISILVALILGGSAIVAAYLIGYRGRASPEVRDGPERAYKEGYLRGYTDCRIEYVDEQFFPDIEEEITDDEDDEDDEGYCYEQEPVADLDFERLYTSGWEESGEAEKQARKLERVLGPRACRELGLKK